MSFVNAHFVTYARDLGFSPMVAAGAFSLIGAASIVGALILGNLSDKHGRRLWLGFSYNLRSVGFLVVLLSMGISFLGIPPLGLPALMVGVVLVGFSFNATVSITAAYTSDHFGASPGWEPSTAPCTPSCPWGAAWARSLAGCSTM